MKQNKSKVRLDKVVLDRGFASDLRGAESIILAGRIRELKTGRILDKAGSQVSSDIQIELVGTERFVSRGGEKLDAFLSQSQLAVDGLHVLDVGSSTGGFADCLIQRGAERVYCVDVGTHQLHEKLRHHPQIAVHEQTDIRSFDLGALMKLPELVVVDVSFISLRSIMPRLLESLPFATYVLLFKPQFEVSKFIPKKRGVAPRPEADKALEEMLLFLAGLGFNPRMVVESALKGAKGNQEFFILGERMMIPQTIFRTYDIRGNAERDLSSPSIERIAMAFAEKVIDSQGKDAVVGVGRDARESSPRLFEAVQRGFSRAGLNYVNLGLTATPMTYFAHYHFKLSGIIQITASHNPREDNGLKMMIGRETLFGEAIQQIKKRALEISELPLVSVREPVQDLQESLRSEYAKFLHDQFKISRKWKIAVDCGNGMAGVNIRSILSKYASELEVLFEDVDCTFPNHEADPTVEKNLSDLKRVVLNKGFDLGFAFDGDGDRLGVITASGRVVWGDEIVMLLSELVLREQPGATIIGEVKCSEKLFRMIKERGGQPLMYKTGHSLIKKKMKEVGAPIAGEMSGHLFFADRYFGYDDATYGALRVLEVMDKLGLDLDAWIKTYPESIVTPELRVDCEESEKTTAVEQVKKFFFDKSGVHLNLIDGVRVGFEDGSWALVRASNTQAVLVVRIEATSLSRLEELKILLEEALDKKLPDYKNDR